VLPPVAGPVAGVGSIPNCFISNIHLHDDVQVDCS